MWRVAQLSPSSAAAARVRATRENVLGVYKGARHGWLGSLGSRHEFHAATLQHQQHDRVATTAFSVPALPHRTRHHTSPPARFLKVNSWHTCALTRAGHENVLFPPLSCMPLGWHLNEETSPLATRSERAQLPSALTVGVVSGMMRGTLAQHYFTPRSKRSSRLDFPTKRSSPRGRTKVAKVGPLRARFKSAKVRPQAASHKKVFAPHKKVFA